MISNSGKTPDTEMGLDGVVNRHPLFCGGWEGGLLRNLYIENSKKY